MKNRKNKKLKLNEKQSKLLNILCHQKKIIFFWCVYKMVDISAEIWNKAKFSLINIHENDDINQILCISDVKKNGVVKIFMT